MTNEEYMRAVIYDATHGTDDEILAEARERYAVGQSIRGLPRPHDAPADAWWTVQRRKLRSTGEPVAYLMLRWRYPETPGGPTARSLGRLDNATA